MQGAEGEVVQNLDVGAMGISQTDVLYERDLFQDVFARLSFVQAAINDSQRNRLAMAKEDQRRHVKQLIDLAGDPCKS